MSKKTVAKKEIFFIKSKGLKAEGDLIDDGFVVFKGSEVAPNTQPSCHKYTITHRNNLLEEGILKDLGEKWIFTEDYIFKTPSGAAMVIQGRTANGWRDWKNKDGKTLDELKRQN